MNDNGVIYVIGVFITLLVYFILGNYSGKKVKNLEDYYVSGRNAPTVLIVGTLAASWTSTASFLGDVGMAYDGYPALNLWLMLINAAGYMIGVMVFGRFMRRSEVLTVAEFFEKRFNSKLLRKVAGVVMVVGMFAYLLEATQGCSVILSELLNIDHLAALLIVWVVYVIFTVYSGSKGVILTDTMMLFIFTICIFTALPYVIDTGSGWEQIMLKLTEGTQGVGQGPLSWCGKVGTYQKWTAPTDGFTWAVLMGISWAIAAMVSPWQTSRYLMAKNEHVAVRSGVIAGFVTLVSYLGLMIIGVSTRTINPNIVISERAFVWLAYNILPVGVGVLALGGILAAGLSSASTFLSLTGMSITADIFGSKIKNEKQQLKITRLTAIGVSFLALICCATNTISILWMANFAGTIFAASWGVACICSVWCKWITEKGCLYGIIAGLSANLIPKAGETFFGWNFPTLLDPFFLGLITSFIVTLLVSKYTPNTPDGLAFRQSLFDAGAEFYNDKRKLKNTKKVIVTVAILCALISVTLIYFYALPYNSLV